MTEPTIRDERIRLTSTRKALGRIRDAAIRADLERVVAGAEVCLAHREFFLAFDAVRTVVTTVVALHRTISPEATAGVLDGLLDDSKHGAIALQRGLGFTKTTDSKCDIKTGSPIGSSSCVSQKDSTCYTLDSGSGCGGTSGFHFVWEAALESDGGARRAG